MAGSKAILRGGFSIIGVSFCQFLSLCLESIDKLTKGVYYISMVEVARRPVTRILHKCLKCGKEWFPQKSNPNPIRCPECKTKHWDNPAKQYKRKLT